MKVGERIRRLEGTNRYGVVLLAVLVSLLFNLAAPQQGWPRVLGTALEGAALLVALWVVPLTRKRLGFVLGLAVAAAAIVQVIVGDKVEGSGRLFYAALTSVLLVVIAHGVWRHLREGVTVDAVYGALAIYVMIGAFFAAVDNSVRVFGGGRFLVDHPAANFEDILYFSYSTLTTLGYGDLTPATELARTLAIAEALVGQFYLVTVLALLVSSMAHRWARVTPGPFADSAGQGRQAATSEDAALCALELRYAKGEIDDADFERRRTTLARGGGDGILGA